MSVNFKPLRDGILVKRIEAESKTASGIIIPDTAKEKPIQGEVCAVGEGARDNQGNLIKMNLKKGDRILFGKWAGTDLKLNNADYLVMKESDVLGVIE